MAAGIALQIATKSVHYTRVTKKHTDINLLTTGQQKEHRWQKMCSIFTTTIDLISKLAQGQQCANTLLNKTDDAQSCTNRIINEYHIK